MSTGLPWLNEENNGLCKDVVPQIEKGLSELMNHPEKYRPYEAENGWGTVEGTINFFREILRAWEDIICYKEEFAEVATFWIE